MKNIIILVLLLSLLSSSLYGSREVGFTGIQAWTDQEKFISPSGYGFFYYESLSNKFNLRFDYNKISEQNSFCGTFFTRIPPSEDDYICDYFSGKLKLHSFELAVLYTLKESKPLSFEIGLGINLSYFRSDITGRDSGYEMRYDRDKKLGISLITNFVWENIDSLPFNFYLGFRKRFIASTDGKTGCTGPSPITISISDIRFGISLPLSN